MASGSLYVPTALLARRDAIAVDESGEVWAVTLMELRAVPVQNQRAKPPSRTRPGVFEKVHERSGNCEQQHDSRTTTS
jgi:hypothetical protein